MKRFISWLVHKLGLYTKSDITRYRGLAEDYKKEINRLNEEVSKLNKECDKLKEHPYILREREYIEPRHLLCASLTINDREREHYTKDDIVRALGHQIANSANFYDNIKVIEEYSPVRMTYTYKGYL